MSAKSGNAESGSTERGLDASASPLGDRYTVVRELGHGGFGQTYLAKDGHHHGELRVVKEFLPQVEDKAMIAKVRELFECEADVLYQLGHNKQIPDFRQLLTVESETRGRLFIVQDYMSGPTYQSLLESRQRFGGKFTETEITQLLYQLLPVLAYIHGLGLVHRDICPDNLILRQTDGLPVLIDFGSVKEIAATVRSQLAIEGGAPVAPRLGKAGYLPPEQLATGKASPASDLYGLAATLLVLATGEAPETLRDAYHGGWRGYEQLSPKLGNILKRMLASNPGDRFPTAEAVLSALQAVAETPDTVTDMSSDHLPDGADVFIPVGSGDSLYPPVGSIEPVGEPVGGPVGEPVDAAGAIQGPVNTPLAGNSHDPAMTMTDTGMMAGSLEMPAVPLSRVDSAADQSEVYIRGTANTMDKSGQKQALWGLLAMLGVMGALLLFALMRGVISRPSDPISASETPAFPEIADGEFSPEESARRQEITTRREALDIRRQYFIRLVDQLFYQTYPDLLTSGPDGDRMPLSRSAKDEPLRLRWDHTALDLLARLEDSNLSEQSLRALGGYSERDRSRWQSQLDRVNVDMRSLYDLADARFLALFPSQPMPDGLTQPTGQLYYALADDSARAIEFGRVTEDIPFALGDLVQEVEGELAPGDGKIYTLSLLDGQRLKLNLTAPAESTLLSLYVPEPTDQTPFVFEDSEQIIWSGAVTQSGVYELVVVSQFPRPVKYQLRVSVVNVSTLPPLAEEEEEVLPADDGDASVTEGTSEETTETSEETTETSEETTQPFIQTDESTGVTESQ